MKITKTIELQIEKKGNYVVVGDLPTLQLLLGTKGISGNYHLWKIKKEKNKFIVPIQTIKDRINVLEERLKKTEESLKIMEQVV